MMNKRILKTGALAVAMTGVFAIFAFRAADWTKGLSSEFIVYGQSTGGTSGGTTGGTGGSTGSSTTSTTGAAAISTSTSPSARTVTSSSSRTRVARGWTRMGSQMLHQAHVVLDHEDADAALGHQADQVLAEGFALFDVETG